LNFSLTLPGGYSAGNPALKIEDGSNSTRGYRYRTNPGPKVKPSAAVKFPQPRNLKNLRRDTTSTPNLVDGRSHVNTTKLLKANCLHYSPIPNKFHQNLFTFESHLCAGKTQTLIPDGFDYTRHKIHPTPF